MSDAPKSQKAEQSKAHGRDVAADKPKPPLPAQHQERPGLEQQMTLRPEYKGKHFCGSITGLEGNKDLLDYSSTKGAIHAFTKSLAQNLVEKGIRVNCVSPTPVWTPLNIVDKPADEAGKHGEGAPLKRPAQPEEIAPAFVFFASQGDSSYITGEVLTLLGGRHDRGLRKPDRCRRAVPRFEPSDERAV